LGWRLTLTRACSPFEPWCGSSSHARRYPR